MSKQMKKTIFGILGGIVLMLLIAYLPPETEMMSRQGWQYLGCFGFLLTCLISGALPDWVATLATMVMLLVFKLGKVADVTVEFSGTTVWLCIGVFIMSVGINNSGFMKRLALWVLTKFPGTYRGQVTAMMLAGIITTPMIPSSYAKTSIMAPLIGQVCEAVGAEPNSKAARGLWFANFMGTYILGIAFMSGSAFVALMIGFMQGLAFTWGSWLKCTIVWYLVLIVLTYLYCTIICKPKEKLAGDVTFLKEQYKALGAISKKEKQGIIIVAIAIILWITQKLHGVDAGFVAIAADVAFFAAGLLTAPEANAKGQWTRRHPQHRQVHEHHRRQRMAGQPARPHLRAHHEQPVYLRSLPVHHHVCPALRDRVPDLHAHDDDRHLRTAHGGTRHEHVHPRLCRVAVRHVLEHRLRQPVRGRLHQDDRRQVRRLSLRAEGFLRLHGHNDHRHAGQRPALAGDWSLLIRISPSDPPSPVQTFSARGTLSRCAAGQGA